MRARHLSLIVLLLLLIVTGVGYRDSGITARTPPRETPQSPSVPPVPLPNRDGSFKFGVLGDFGTGQGLHTDKSIHFRLHLFYEFHGLVIQLFLDVPGCLDLGAELFSF